MKRNDKNQHKYIGIYAKEDEYKKRNKRTPFMFGVAQKLNDLVKRILVALRYRWNENKDKVLRFI